MPHTLVSFHAHPDDETLFTGGTLARAAAAGHRVVLVTATDGGLGATSSDFGTGLGSRRLAELERAAAALGVARTVNLGYPDSGFPHLSPDPAVFARQDPDGPAAALAQILREESADALTTYDPLGGYGHPDHRQVHQVALRAARLVGTGCVLQATVDRDLIVRAVRLARLVPGLLDANAGAVLAGAFTPRSLITHRVDVRRHLAAKRAALQAHASQAAGSARTAALLLRLPGPLFSRVLGTEWFVDRSLSPGRRDDIFASLAPPGGQVHGSINA